MKLRAFLIGGGVALLSTPALAGGLFTPGSGAVSTARAGAAVASTDDGEAMSINPAGFAKAEGLKVTVSATLLQYYMSFTRRGAYDAITNDPRPYENQPYATITNTSKPPLGVGGWQPLPVITISYAVPQVKGLVVAGGLYTPQGYPFRDMTSGYDFAKDVGGSKAPPAGRYDVMTQEAALLLPSIAVAYRITPDLDVGARFTAGNFQNKTAVAVWGTPGNVAEDVQQDALFTANVKDNFIPALGLGGTYRIGANIELGAAWSSPLAIHSSGTAESVKGPLVDQTRIIGAVPDKDAVCATGGTMDKQKACISLQLPMTATVGARYKILDENDKERADIELDLNWENWGKRCNFDDAHVANSDCTSPGQYRVQIDAGLYNTSGQYIDKVNSVNGANVIDLGLRDTYGVRLGGSYRYPIGANKLIARAGLGMDTAAAKTGWLRTSFDGAPRQTLAIGGAYETAGWQINAGFGYIHEGKNTNPGALASGKDCNPTETDFGCNGDGTMRAPENRQGPDPTNPLLTPASQFENPINQGSITSHYLMFMIGFSKGW